MRAALAAIRSQGPRRNSHRLIHLAVEIYLLASLVALAPVAAVVAGLYFGWPRLLAEQSYEALLPTLYWIDRSGKVDSRQSGFQEGDEQVLEAKLRTLLERR